jgi:hypothetical protein
MNQELRASKRRRGCSVGWSLLFVALAAFFDKRDQNEIPT